MDMSRKERPCYCKGEKPKIKGRYASHKIENPIDKLCLSKFWDLQPPEVKLIREISHSSCFYIYHENA